MKILLNIFAVLSFWTSNTSASTPIYALGEEPKGIFRTITKPSPFLGKMVFHYKKTGKPTLSYDNACALLKKYGLGWISQTRSTLRSKGTTTTFTVCHFNYRGYITAQGSRNDIIRRLADALASAEGLEFRTKSCIAWPPPPLW